MPRLHLASRSPRRRKLLEEAGIPYVPLDVEVDETSDESLAPEDLVVELARRKAMAGASLCHEGWVLGADTLVVLGERMLGKPADRREAERTLASLSGVEHRVLTGVALVDAAGDGSRDLAGFACTRVTMRRLDPEEIRAYVASGEADDKAGAYAIQENGGRFVERIEGSWSNVVGLPIELVEDLLARLETGS
jgi:septum formation protein